MKLTKHKPAPRVSAYQPKRPGVHHAPNRHFLRAYWPYVPVFMVLGLGLLFNLLLNHQNHTTAGYANGIQTTALLSETNGERTSNHEPALQLNPSLTAAARAKAADMATRNYWSHVTPDGKQPWSFMQAAGYHFEAAGENLAYGFGTSDEVIKAWMLSPEHRANLLNGNYQDVGFATVQSKDFVGTGHQTIVVALYGEPVGMINPSNSSSGVLGAATVQVSRLQIFSNMHWVALSISIAAAIGIGLFFLRHAFAWHKVLVRGEEFFVHHPFFDAFLIGLAVLAFLLSHAAGVIL
jgi:hypothetical protein